MPCSMSSNLPGRDRSSRLTMLGLSWPSVADFCASSRSLALAARISSRASARASWTASSAAFLAEVGSVASFLDESLAARAASSAEALVSDMLVMCYTCTRGVCKGLSPWVWQLYYRGWYMLVGWRVLATFCSSHRCCLSKSRVLSHANTRRTSINKALTQPSR
jgi:hypothetical protein